MFYHFLLIIQLLITTVYLISISFLTINQMWEALNYRSPKFTFFTKDKMCVILNDKYDINDTW